MSGENYRNDTMVVGGTAAVGALSARMCLCHDPDVGRPCQRATGRIKWPPFPFSDQSTSTGRLQPRSLLATRHPRQSMLTVLRPCPPPSLF